VAFVFPDLMTSSRRRPKAAGRPGDAGTLWSSVLPVFGLVCGWPRCPWRCRQGSAIAAQRHSLDTAIALASAVYVAAAVFLAAGAAFFVTRDAAALAHRAHMDLTKTSSTDLTQRPQRPL